MLAQILGKRGLAGAGGVRRGGRPQPDRHAGPDRRPDDLHLLSSRAPTACRRCATWSAACGSARRTPLSWPGCGKIDAAMLTDERIQVAVAADEYVNSLRDAADECLSVGAGRVKRRRRWRPRRRFRGPVTWSTRQRTTSMSCSLAHCATSGQCSAMTPRIRSGATRCARRRTAIGGPMPRCCAHACRSSVPRRGRGACRPIRSMMPCRMCCSTIHRVRHTYDPARPFLPWLRAIARARAVDLLRRNGRQAARELNAPVEYEAHPDRRPGAG